MMAKDVGLTTDEKNYLQALYTTYGRAHISQSKMSHLMVAALSAKGAINPFPLNVDGDHAWKITPDGIASL